MTTSSDLFQAAVDASEFPQPYKSGDCDDGEQAGTHAMQAADLMYFWNVMYLPCKEFNTGNSSRQIM
jgi:hypothetical protein